VLANDSNVAPIKLASLISNSKVNLLASQANLTTILNELSSGQITTGSGGAVTAIISGATDINTAFSLSQNSSVSQVNLASSSNAVSLSYSGNNAAVFC
jgi:mannitol-1-phosphate/altronate dehydrogenase